MGNKIIVRSITKEGIELIKHFEGFFPNVYLCPAGYPTIGWGHVVRKGEDFAGGITEDQGEEILRTDLKRYELSVCRLIHVPLDDGMYDALVSFTFNLGGGALQRSTLRAKVNREEYWDAADEFLRWVYASGRKLKGLVKRRTAEGHLFIYGDLMYPIGI